MVFLSLMSHFDIYSDLLTPDKNAILAFVYGCIGGILGTYIRNRLITDAKPDTKKEGFGHYFGWAAFGSLVALTLNSLPILSVIIGIFAPAFLKGMEKKVPDIVDFIGARISAIFGKTDKKTEKE